MRSSHVDSALLMMGARVLSIVVGLAGIPILLNFLGTEGFAAWAVLFGGSVAFYALEMGMTPTVVKFLAEINHQENLSQFSGILTNAMALLLITYTLAGMGVLAIAVPLAAWLNLPDTPLLTADKLIAFVFVAVGISSMLRTGINTFFASRRFGAVAGISALQSISSNVASWLAAIMWGRLDLVLIAYWLTQLLVLLISWLWARRQFPWQFRLDSIRFETMKSMLSHGFNLQFNELMYFVHFQFDKMIIAGFAGLTEVAHYEVASRAGQALRSLPFTAITTFLPTATEKLAKGGDIWPIYIEMTRAASLAAVLLLLLPLAVSPIFLFAWVGQIGYHGRWVFMLLAIGISISILAMPVSNFIQAMGRTAVDAKFAIVSVTINVVLSLLLIQIWGKEGAAAGTGLAMLITGLAYMRNFHVICKRRLMDTIDHLVEMFWPALLICLVCFGLERIIEPWVISSRWYMGPTSVALYAFGAIAILAVMLSTNRLGQSEMQLLARIPFVRTLIEKNPAGGNSASG